MKRPEGSNIGLLALFLVLITITGLSCAGGNNPGEATNDKTETGNQAAVMKTEFRGAGEAVSVSEGKVVESINRFAFDFFSFLKKKESGNIFYSPFSLSLAMSMTYEGARGKTAEEIKQVFHYPDDSQILRQGFSEIIARLNKENKKYQLQTASALWA